MDFIRGGGGGGQNPLADSVRGEILGGKGGGGGGGNRYNTGMYTCTCTHLHMWRESNPGLRCKSVTRAYSCILLDQWCFTCSCSSGKMIYCSTATGWPSRYHNAALLKQSLFRIIPPSPLLFYFHSLPYINIYQCTANTYMHLIQSAIKHHSDIGFK